MSGLLKGFDSPIMNLVLDDTIEYMENNEENGQGPTQQRFLGLVVCRGSAVMVLAPEEGTSEIANPFLDNNQEVAI